MNDEDREEIDWVATFKEIGYLEEKKVRIPEHLIKTLIAIAKRQHTTVEVIVAQAIRDYCEGGL